MRYRGYYYDTNTGLYYPQSRYYGPETGRFINADTLIVASDYLQGTNMFAYCLNNPVMYVDPTGCEAEYSKVLLDLCKVIVSAIIIGTVFDSEDKAVTFAKALINKGLSYDEIYDESIELLYDVKTVIEGETISATGNYAGIIVDFVAIAGTNIGPMGTALTVATTIVDIGSGLIDPRLDNTEKALAVAEGALGVASNVVGVELAMAVTSIASPLGVGAPILGAITYGIWTVYSYYSINEILG